MNNDLGIGLAFLIGILAVGLVVGLLVASLILRASVWLTNKAFGRPPAPAYDDDDEFDYDPDPGRKSARDGTPIPVPGIGWGMVVALVSGFVGFLLQILVYAVPVGIGLGGGGGGLILAAYVVMILVCLPLGFLAHAGVLAAMLPTSFGRGCLVVLFNYLVLIAAAVVLCTLSFVAGLLFRLGQ